jgi:hypothetical protein
MDKNKAISLAIIANMQAGKSLEEAFNAVLGDNKYDEMVADLYQALCSKSRDKVLLSDYTEK